MLPSWLKMLARLWEAIVTATLMGLPVGLAFIVCERLWPALPEQRHLRPQAGLDVFYLYLGFCLFVVVDLSWIGALADLSRKTTVGAALGQIGDSLHGLSLPVEILVALVIADFFGYWKHRLFHTRFMWPFHAVHHSSENVDWLSNDRSHPVETIMTSVMQVGPLLALGFAPQAIALVAFLRRTHSVYEHTNLRFAYGRFSYFLVSPSFHRWHHAPDDDVIDKNYANVFSLWDVLFRTYHVPARPAPASLGIAKFPSGMLGQFIQPFRDLARSGGRAKTAE